MKILSIIRDDRISATSVLLEMSVREYIDLVPSPEANLDIQRSTVQGFKPYERLREDLKLGCLVPPIVLAAKEGRLPNPHHNQDFLLNLMKLDTKMIYIVDGVQRTNAIHQVMKTLEGKPDFSIFLGRSMRVEIWPDITMNSLTYRMILLNAAQKPMSLRHQLEVVHVALREYLNERFGATLQLYMEKDTDRRSKPGEYQFSLIAQAFQAFLQKSPHLDLRNEVIDELTRIDVLETFDAKPVDLFSEYMQFLYEFDKEIFRVYPERVQMQDGDVPSGKSLLTRDTFHLGLAAAYSWCKAHKPDQLDAAKYRLMQILTGAEPYDHDPLALARYEKIIANFKRKDNVGEQRRNVTFRGFREFFSTGGQTPMERCWLQG